MSASSS